MKGNMSDDFMATDGPSSDSSTELVTPFENGKKEPKRPSPRKMERVDSGSRRRPATESSSSSSSSGATTQPTKRNSLTPPRQELHLSTAGGAHKTRSKAKAMEEIETSGRDSRRLNASSHSPRRSAHTATYTRSQSQSGLIVRETRSRDLSVDAATRRSRERSIDATYRRAHKRSLSKDRSTEAQNSTAQPSTHSPRSIRQNTVLDSLDTAIQRRAGRKPDSLSTSRHGDPSVNSKQLGSSTHGGRRRASVPDSLSTSRHAESTGSTGSHSCRDPTQSQIRRSLSDDHRKPYMESLDSSSHRRPARNKDPLGGSRHGPAPSQPNSAPHRSHSMEKSSTAADSRGMPPIAGNQRRAAKKDDVLGRSRHSDPTPAQGLNASSHMPRSRSGERRKQVADSLGMVSQRRAARKDDLLGGSIHEPSAGGHTQRRSTGGIAHTPSTPSTTVKPNVDCFKNLSRLLSDSAVSPNKTDDHRGDANSHENDNILMDLLTTDLTPKQLRRALRAHKKVEEAKSSKQQQQQQQQQNDNGSHKQDTNGEPSALDKLGIVLDPSTSFEQNQTSNAVEEDLIANKQANPLGSSMDHADSTTAPNNFPSNKETTTTSLPRPRQMRRHTMDHAPKQNLDPEPTATGSLRDAKFQRSTSFGAFEEEQEEDNDDHYKRPMRPSTTGHHQISTKRRFGKRGEGQLEAMKRDRDNRKQSVKDSILSILDE